MERVGACCGVGMSPSPSKRNRSSPRDLLAAVEFVSDGSSAAQVVRQFSPYKSQKRGMAPPQPSAGTTLESLRGSGGLGACGIGQGPAGSPTAVADMPAAPSTASQPSSATSSLAAALADLQVSSRQSSANDLGDRSRLLASLPRALRVLHSRSDSGDELAGMGGFEEGLCSPKLVSAVRTFDNLVLKTLSPIKTRSRTTTSAAEATTAGGQASPAVPYAESLVAPFEPALRPKHAPGRAVVYHSHGSSGMQAPGAYNPYDLVAAALSTEFRSPAKSLHSPFTHSRGPSASATPSQWSASHRAASYRNLAAQQALQQQKDDEPDYYVSVPGVRRTLSVLSGLSSCGASPAVPQAAQRPAGDAAAPAPAAHSRLGGMAAPAAATVGSSPQVAASQTPGTASSLRHQPSSSTLGSGTTVHGFKGLFRSIIVARGQQ